MNGSLPGHPGTGAGKRPASTHDERSPVKPFHFGQPDKPLFGVYHAAVGLPARTVGVVLCYPAWEEYMRAHHAFRQTAMLLARRGFHVIRFDYFGTGDSAGAGEEATMSRWLADIGTAIDELKAVGGPTTVSLVGLRLGAALAALAAGERDDVDRVVLWDPIIDGRAYMEEIVARYGGGQSNGKRPAASQGEIMGYPLSEELRDGITKIDLRLLPRRTVPHAFLMVSRETPEYLRCCQDLSCWSNTFTYDCVPSPGDWSVIDDYGSAYLPQQLIQQIVTRLAAE